MVASVRSSDETISPDRPNLYKLFFFFFYRWEPSHLIGYLPDETYVAELSKT